MVPLILALSLAPPARAGRITVDPHGSGDFTTVQDAIDAAGHGDFIALQPGIYDPFLARSGLWAGPVVGLGGPDAVQIDGTGVSATVQNAANRELRLEGMRIQGGTYGVYVYNAAGVELFNVELWSQTYGLYAYNAVVEANGLTVQDASSYGLYLHSTATTLSHVTLATTYGAYLYNSTVSLDHALASGTLVESCSSTSGTLSHALQASGTLPGCLTVSSVYAGFDPGFVDHSDDGDPSNDDLALAATSLAVDAGTCTDRDGTACDLGATGGPVGSATDSDADGLPDWWEAAWGMDPATDDNLDDDDGDGLDALGEYLFGTDPTNADTDGDGVDDQTELEHAFDPLMDMDQTPFATALPGPAVLVGETATVDASRSVDPVGQPLTYSWRFVSKPAASALTNADLIGDVEVSFRPDVAGPYQVELSVDDGRWTATETAIVLAFDGAQVRIPQDFESWEMIEDDVMPGTTVIFDAGTWAVSVLPDLDRITLQGAGRDATVLELGFGYLAGRTLTLRDVTLQGDSDALRLRSDAVLLMDGVGLDGGVRAIDARESTVVGHDVVLTGTSPLSVQYGSLWLGNGWIQGGANVYFESAAGLTGVVVHQGPLQSSGAAVDLNHVTLLDPGAETALWASDSWGRATHLAVDDAAIAFATGSVLVDHVWLGPGVDDVGTPPFRSVRDTRALGPDGTPAAGSSAWDGGDWRQQDQDGTAPDLGATGGPTPYRRDHGLTDPWQDQDSDGVPHVLERVLGTRDDATDSDGDGVGDWFELVDQTNPGDPTDHHPTLQTWPVRTPPSATPVLVNPGWTDDPDGEACTLEWDDGTAPGKRQVPIDQPGTILLDWTLRCGPGASHGTIEIHVEETVRVPDDVATLQQALDQRLPHHTIELAEGAYSLDLTTDTPLALQGQGHVVIEGSLQVDAAGALRDVDWVGPVRLEQAALNRVVVLGELEIGDGLVRNVLVDDGDLSVLGPTTSVANVTVDGDLSGPLLNLRSSAVTGALRVGDLSPVAVSQGVGPAHFIAYDPDPEAAILEPWPGSELWDSGSQQDALRDVDGSREDRGWTGGPAARPVDADADGLNDRWEGLYGVDDPLQDPDGDTLTNAQEFALGTDPTSWDTDGDRLSDHADPNPLVAGTAGLVAVLSVDDRVPRRGQQVWADALASTDPAYAIDGWTWTLDAPPGSAAVLIEDGPRVRFTPDVAGTYGLDLRVHTTDGAHADDSVIVRTRSVIQVTHADDLAQMIEDAPEGSVLELEEGAWSQILSIDKDLVLVGAAGATGTTLEAPANLPVLTVNGGAWVRLEGLTVRGADEAAALAVSNATVELRQSRVIAENLAMTISGGQVLATSSMLAGHQVAWVYQGSFTGTNVVLVPAEPFTSTPAVVLESASVHLAQSVVQWPQGIAPLQCYALPCDGSLSDTLATPEWLESQWIQAQLRVQDADPMFLAPPDTTLKPGVADYRLQSQSPGVDAGSAFDPDPDGTPADLGVYGGRWADWVDIDNDRDGYTNLEGDCDDFDPTLIPDLLGQRCVSTEGACDGCASGRRPALPVWMALALAVTVLRRRSRQSFTHPG